MQKPANAELIREIINKTDGLGYMQIQGKTAEERKADLLNQIQEKLARYHNDGRKNRDHRS